jgi:hypothetical protein
MAASAINQALGYTTNMAEHSQSVALMPSSGSAT